MKKLVMSVLLVNLLAACASNQPKAPAVESQPAATSESSGAGAGGAAGGSSASASSVTTSAMEVDPLNDPQSILAKRSVYYPFDVYVVQDADKPIVQAHAQYLRDHENRKVRLEGNCDERGSTEYNLALGQRRADGVRKMLMLGGVQDGQIETISYGEEKPRATGHDESAWAQNRRTDLNYLQ
jgi:peptidoglycan-associated lipoprotein